MRKPIRKVSLRRQKLNREYAKVKREWKARLIDLGQWYCWECVKGVPSDSPHHKFGRGPNLLNPRTFIAVCPKCHQGIHDFPEAARKRGMLCNKGQWMTRQP